MKKPASLNVTSILPILIVAAGFTTFNSCKKNNNNASYSMEISDVRTGGNIKVVNLIYSPGTEAVTAITLKNQSNGSGNVHVKLNVNDAGVAATGSAKLRPANYTLPSTEFDVAANASVAVPITINKTGLSIDSTYGLAFTINHVSSGTIASDADSIIVKFDQRNRWDGHYKITGSMTDVSTTTITFTAQDVKLVSSSANSVTMIPDQLGIPGYLILSGGSLSYYGSFGPVFTFDATTNKVISVVNSYGQPASNTRSADIDPSGLNQWEPATKNIPNIKFFMKQPNTVTTPPYIRTYFNNTFTYLGPRF